MENQNPRMSMDDSRPDRVDSDDEPSPKRKKKQKSSSKASDEYAVKSGPKKTFHGYIYQIKLLMLFIKRGTGRNYLWRLATEMDKAEKFDDLVLEFKIVPKSEHATASENAMESETATQSEKVYRCLQAKHNQAEDKKIETSHLLSSKEENIFNLKEYFRSYCRTKEALEFKGSIFKDFIICTNRKFNETDNLINIYNKDVLDRDDLSPEKIYLERISEPDDFLSFRGTQKPAELLKFIYNKKNKVFQYLKNNYSIKTGFTQSSSRDEVEDEDIEGFLNKLIFAVNQPDEEELGSIISKEIGDDDRLNLSNVVLVGAFFEKEILDWFKERSGRWYTKNDFERFFESLVDKVSTLVCVGLSLAYRENLDGYGIEFKDEIEELNNFLTRDVNQELEYAVLNLIAAKETLLTAIRVDRVIRKLPETNRYKKNDSLIFLPERSLQEQNIKELVINAFKSEQSHHLLVIDCKSTKSENLEDFCHQLHQIMQHRNKKLILITLKNALSAVGLDIFLKNCDNIPDDVGFENLEKESQRKLISEKMINFQGKQKSTSLKELLGKSNADENVTTELKYYEKVIDARTLVKLILGDDIKVGSDLRGLGKTQDYYIPRRISRQVIIEDRVLKSDLRSDLIAISAADGGSSEKLIKDVEKVRFEDIDPSNQDLHSLIILDPKQGAKQFEKLCEITGKNVHLLKIVGKKLIWQQSKGDVTALVKYRDMSESGSSSDDNIDERAVTTLLEKEQVDYIERQKIFIISDEPGMGKSTVFTRLAQMMKKKKPGQWVIRIDLNDYTNELTAKQMSRNVDGSYTDGVEFFVENLSGLSDNFDKTILKTAMKENRGEVTLLFDGFDEISPGFTDTVFDLLQGLKKIDIAKILISTRPEMREKLEIELGTFTHTMKPFNPRNRINFLVKFWKANLGLYEDDEHIEQQLKKYAKVLTVRIVQSVDARAKKLAGIPILTQMTAEIFPYNGEKTVETVQKMAMYDLYTQFVKKKYDRYGTKKKKEMPNNQHVIRDNKILHKAFSEGHEKIALHTLFNKQVLPQRLYILEEEETQIEEYLDNIIEEVKAIGIINQVINGRAQFIHRTFAEYFVATFISNTLLKRTGHELEARSFVLEQILSDSNNQHKVIRGFLNDQLPEDPGWSDASARETWKADLEANLYARDEPDQNYDTIFHKIATEGHFKIVKLFLNLFDDRDQKRKNWINVRNQKFHRTLLHIAAENQNWDELKWLIEKEGVDVNLLPADKRTALHTAASFGNLDIVKWLVEKGAVVEAPDWIDNMPLHEAAKHGKSSVVKWLVEEKQASLTATNDKGRTVLHAAALHRHWDLLKWLAKQAGADVNVKDKKGITVLLTAAQFHEWHIVEYLIKSCNADVRVESNSGDTALKYAEKSDKPDIINLIRNKMKIEVIYKGPTDLIIDQEETDIALYARNMIKNFVAFIEQNLPGDDSQQPAARKFILEKILLDRETQYEKSRDCLNDLLPEEPTWPEASALEQAWKDDLERLCSPKGTIKAAKDTIFHKLAKEGNFRIVKLFLNLYEQHHQSRQYYISVGDEQFGRTLVHLASEFKHWDGLKWLIQAERVDVNSRTRDGRTPLHNTAMSGNLDMMQLLVAEGAHVDALDRNQRTPLFKATKRGMLHVVKWLVKEKGADLEIQTNKGRTVLHVATTRHHYDIVKWLVEEGGANVNARDGKNSTPLLLAAKRGYLDMIQLLLKSDKVEDDTIDDAFDYYLELPRSEQGDEILRLLCESTKIQTP